MYQSIKRDTRYSRGAGDLFVVIGCTNNSKRRDINGSWKLQDCAQHGKQPQ